MAKYIRPNKTPNLENFYSSPTPRVYSTEYEAYYIRWISHSCSVSIYHCRPRLANRPLGIPTTISLTISIRAPFRGKENKNHSNFESRQVFCVWWIYVLEPSSFPQQTKNTKTQMIKSKKAKTFFHRMNGLKNIIVTIGGWWTLTIEIEIEKTWIASGSQFIIRPWGRAQQRYTKERIISQQATPEIKRGNVNTYYINQLMDKYYKVRIDFSDFSIQSG